MSCVSRLGDATGRLLPAAGLPRQLSIQSVLYAFAQGSFVTGSAVFFTQVVGLSAPQVGLGMTIAGLVTFALAVPLGRMADRVGTKRTWVVATSAAAALFATWPLVEGFWEFVVVVTLVEVAATAAWSGAGAYMISALPQEQRVRSMAFMRAAANTGFTLGALLGGLALALDSLAVVRAVPLVTAALQVVNALWVARLPDPPAGAEADAASPLEQVGRGGALRNRGFLALMTLDGVLNTNQVLLNVVIPLWLVEQTDAPRVLLAWLFGTNTVLAVLLQVRATRGVDSVATSVRASHVSAGFFALSCAVVAVTHETVGWVTIVLIWLGHVTVTGAELFQSAGHWGYLSELSDPRRRGEYQGVANLGHTAGSVWAPAAFTWLALQHGVLGWATIAVVAVLAGAGVRPAAAAAQRYLERTGAPATA